MKRKYFSWDDCIALREVMASRLLRKSTGPPPLNVACMRQVQSLRKLRHPNIVKLKEVRLDLPVSCDLLRERNTICGTLRWLD
jgi:hypothetical protein